MNSLINSLPFPEVCNRNGNLLHFDSYIYVHITMIYLKKSHLEANRVLVYDDFLAYANIDLFVLTLVVYRRG